MLRLRTKSAEESDYCVRATADELKRGQTSAQIDAFFRDVYPGYRFWSEFYAREGDFEAACQKRINESQREFPDPTERTPLQRKELAALQQDLASAKQRKQHALDQMNAA